MHINVHCHPDIISFTNAFSCSCANGGICKEKYKEIKSAATEVGETINGYVKVAIDERMERQEGIISTESQDTNISNTSGTDNANKSISSLLNDVTKSIDGVSQLGNIALLDKKKKADNTPPPLETNEF